MTRRIITRNTAKQLTDSELVLVSGGTASRTLYISSDGEYSDTDSVFDPDRDSGCICGN